MTDYDKQYEMENDLFGSPYREFEEFVGTIDTEGKSALDVGCGQGRDVMMLAKHGYKVTGIDTSEVGVTQMMEKAQTEKLNIEGIVGDFYQHKFEKPFDSVVMNSILHFYKNDKQKELALLERMSSLVNVNGYLFIFIHKSPEKEKVLRDWLKSKNSEYGLVREGYVKYLYQEKSKGFKSEFTMYIFFARRLM